MKVGLTWLTPTHLEITYKVNREIVFQAIKFRDVEISARESQDLK